MTKATAAKRLADAGMDADKKAAPVLVHSAFRGNDLATIADQRFGKAQRIKKLKAEIDELDKILIPAAIKYGGGFETENAYRVSRVAFDRHTVDQMLLKAELLDAGLTAKQIATVIAKSLKKTPVEYVKVTDREGKE